MYYGYCYNSPTVGLKFPEKDYQVLIENIRYIKNTVIKPRERSKYKWFNEYDQNYPIGYIEINGQDVEIWFVHYKSFEEASQKWKRRCQRIDFNNMVIIQTNYADTTEEDVRKFFNISTPRKIYLCSKKLVFNNENYFFIPELSKYKIMAPYAEAHILYKYLVKASWMNK